MRNDVNTYVCVLVGGDGKKLCFDEEVGEKRFRTLFFRIRIDFDHVNTRLVAVHRVQNNLKIIAKTRKVASLTKQCDDVMTLFDRPYEAVVCQFIVGDFQLSKRHHFLRPVIASVW